MIKFDKQYKKEFVKWISITNLTSFDNRCYEYVLWQNKAISYYISSRVLYKKGLISPSAFCAFQFIENMMKATFIYYFNRRAAESFEHKLRKLANEINNKIAFNKNLYNKIVIPKYMTNERRFQEMTRYPKKGKGLNFGQFVINDLDQLCFNLLILVPFQFNTELFKLLCRKEKTRNKARRALVEGNQYSTKMRRYLKVVQFASSGKDAIRILKELSFNRTKKAAAALPQS